VITYLAIVEVVKRRLLRTVLSGDHAPGGFVRVSGGGAAHDQLTR
jgi:hypothetical protein